MTTSEMHPELAHAVRAELAAIGTPSSRLQRLQRRSRLFAAGVAALVVVAVTTGAAILVSSFPGSTTVTPLGGLHSATGTGPGELELGPVPTGATRAVLTVQCLNSEGSLSIAGQTGDFTTFYCVGGGRVDSQGVVHPWHMNDALLPEKGSTAIKIMADPGTKWSISGQYASSSTTPWGKNANGQTYGQCNVEGCPDLIGARASNGKVGFVFNHAALSISGSGSIPVYESDGTTVIGEFPIG